MAAREVFHLAADPRYTLCDEEGRPHAAGAAQRSAASTPQIIGSSCRVAQAAENGGSQAEVPAPSVCARLPVLLVAAVAAGALVAAGLHLHVAGSSADALHQEVKRLRDENEALLERARLAQREQQDLARLILDPKSRQRVTSMMERSTAFDDFTRRSGFENTPASTAPLWECLGRILWELDITSMLDVPCRDAGWQHLIPGIRNVTYIGGDISIQALEKAKHRKENTDQGMEFMLFDAVHFPLKRSFDLVLFRGLMEQQRVQDSLTAVLNFKASGSKYLAASYWPETPAEANEAAHNLTHAGWYEANLLAAPFNFPGPITSCPNGKPGTPFGDRSRLGIWRLRDLQVTAASVQAADPRRHGAASLQGGLELPGPPHGVHLPRRPGFREQRAPAVSQMTIPHGDLTLDELLGIFGSAFAPERKYLRPAEVEDEERSPFDGLFSDWLETAGPVRRGLPTRRATLPTQVFRLPGFAPQLLR